MLAFQVYVYLHNRACVYDQIFQKCVQVVFTVKLITNFPSNMLCHKNIRKTLKLCFHSSIVVFLIFLANCTLSSQHYSTNVNYISQLVTKIETAKALK